MFKELNMARKWHLNITTHRNITTAHMARVSMKAITLRAMYLQRIWARKGFCRMGLDGFYYEG